MVIQTVRFDERHQVRCFNWIKHLTFLGDGDRIHSTKVLKARMRNSTAVCLLKREDGW